MTWSTHAPVLRAIREAVFVREQGVNETLEWDGLDPTAEHWLALVPRAVDAAERRPRARWPVTRGVAPDDVERAGWRAVGTVRLLASGQIGRLAVLPEWRGIGLGRALLDAALDAARAHQMTTIWLNAQVDRIGFYERAGFVVDGPTFLDAGLPHRRMVHHDTAPPEGAPRPTRPAIDATSASGDRESTAEAHTATANDPWIETLAGARRRVDLWLPVQAAGQESSSWDDTTRVDALVAALTRHPMARLRLLTDGARALRGQTPRLLHALQRLASRVEVAELVADAQHGERVTFATLLVTDTGSHSEDDERHRSPRAARTARQTRFDDAWAAARPSREWSRLAL